MNEWMNVWMRDRYFFSFLFFKKKNALKNQYEVTEHSVFPYFTYIFQVLTAICNLADRGALWTWNKKWWTWVWHHQYKITQELCFKEILIFIVTFRVQLYWGEATRVLRPGLVPHPDETDVPGASAEDLPGGRTLSVCGDLLAVLWERRAPEEEEDEGGCQERARQE